VDIRIALFTVNACDGTIGGTKTSVSIMALRPSLPTLKNTWPDLAARQASIAIPTLPSVEFLKPVGIERADVSSRCTCDSVVRAPIAPQETRSAVYCGVIVSRNSHPAGRPSFAISSNNVRAIRKPLLIWKLPLRSGSLIRP
jgi:hypothetical protein